MSEENWEQFFEEAGIELTSATEYVEIFKYHAITYSIVMDLTTDDFQRMGIKKMGHIKCIQRRAKGFQIVDESYNSIMNRTPSLEVDNSANFKRQRLMPTEKHFINRFVEIIGKSYFVDKSLIIEPIIKLVVLNLCQPTWNQPITKPQNFSSYSEIRLSDPLYLVGPRRFGKTTILHMLLAFFSGNIPEEKLKCLLIYSKVEAMAWYGQFCTIYITFGLSSSVIRSEDDCINACKMALHRAFKAYSYLMPFLDHDRAVTFRNWLIPEKCLDKEIIGAGISFLVKCMLIRHNYSKRCLVLIDEFDGLYIETRSHVNRSTLNKIVSFYSDMVGQAMKHSSNCFGIFTGSTVFTCGDQSSINNLNIRYVLKDSIFFPFYGVTKEE